eukprot:gene19654-biopygen19061
MPAPRPRHPSQKVAYSPRHARAMPATRPRHCPVTPGGGGWHLRCHNFPISPAVSPRQRVVQSIAPGDPCSSPLHLPRAARCTTRAHHKPDPARQLSVSKRVVVPENLEP